MFRKILIVGTTPYSKNTSARAFEAYFSGWERENLAQVFSNPKPPLKGHAEYFYQITDKRLLLRRFFPETKIEKTLISAKEKIENILKSASDHNILREGIKIAISLGHVLFTQ